jgi:hypothetical protein
MITTANRNLISGFDRVRGLCGPAIEHNNARVTKLLGYRATRAKAAQL